MNRIPHRRIERTFDADDFDARPDRMRGDRVARDQTAAADRHDQDIEIRHVFEHFQCDGALPGNNVAVVVGMNPNELALIRQRFGPCLRLEQRFAGEHHFGAKHLSCLDLHERRRHRHHDGGRYAKAARMIGDRLGVIARGHRDHAAAALVRVEGGKLDAGAALLERISDLQILVFDVNLRAGECRKRRRRQHWRAQHVAADGRTCGLDVGQGDLASLFAHGADIIMRR